MVKFSCPRLEPAVLLKSLSTTLTANELYAEEAINKNVYSTFFNRDFMSLLCLNFQMY